jgi:penicillin-binding protein 1A
MGDAHDEGLATYFRTVVRNYLLGWCEEHGYDLFSDGLKIYTTIDSRLQKYAEEAVYEHMRDLQARFFKHWEGMNPWVNENMQEIPRFIEQAAKRSDRYKELQEMYGDDTLRIQKIMNTPVHMKVFSWDGEKDTILSPMDSIRYYKHFLHAGLMSMDPKTGYIKAWVGGIDYKYFKYDHVKQGKRQGGSTFKAFVYTAAMENEFSPCFEVMDAPVTFIINPNTNEVWTPDNSDKSYTGNKLTIRQGLGRSINSVSAYLLKRIGVNNVLDIAIRLGIDPKGLKPVPSVALGSTDVSVYEMVGAYGTFANKGVHIDPFFIIKIEDKSGNVLQQFIPKSTDAISEKTAYLMLHLLKGSTQESGGTALGLYRYGVLQYNEIAAKTGTTSNQSDGWFVGITKDLVNGVWVGGEDRSIHFRDLENGQGSRMAMPIWALYMKKVYEDKSLGITKGYFPKTDNEEILEKIDCKRYKETGQNGSDIDSSEYIIPKDHPIEDLN